MKIIETWTVLCFQVILLICHLKNSSISSKTLFLLLCLKRIFIWLIAFYKTMKRFIAIRQPWHFSMVMNSDLNATYFPGKWKTQLLFSKHNPHNDYSLGAYIRTMITKLISLNICSIIITCPIITISLKVTTIDQCSLVNWLFD